MDQNFVANILSITLFFVPLFVAIRAFALYRKTFSRRLLVLAIAMTIIALTAAAGFTGDNVTSITLNVDWFNYIGQTVSFLFIFLSLLLKQERSLRLLVGWHLLACVPLLLLLFLAPVLPPDFPNPIITKTLLSGSRGVICGLIFYYYMFAFTTKATRFSFLMGSAFLFLSVGYFIVILKYGNASDPSATTIDRLGDITRISGSIALFIAVVRG